MSIICQLNQYTVAVSELTGRAIYINESMDQYLISPDADFTKISTIVTEWQSKIEALRIEHRPPPRIRTAVMKLQNCNSREDMCHALHTLLITEFYDRFNTSSIIGSQRFLVELMLHLWSNGFIAWPVMNQVPFINPLLKIENSGLAKQYLSYLQKVGSYLYRGTTDDQNNIRFILDHLLSRSGIVEIGDITPKTFFLIKERSRRKKLRSTGIQGILSVLREKYYNQAIKWEAEDFGFFQDRMGHLARDDNFTWITTTDPLMSEWVGLAIEHLQNNTTNFKKRKSSINNFLKHYFEHKELPRNPVEYFDIHRRPTALYEVLGNKGRQEMTIIHDFLNEVLFKVCTQPNDNEIPILMPGFASPLVKSSYKNINKGETHREAMPTRLINLAMRILTENDFAWAKEVGRIKDVFRWQNPKTNKFETVWSPVRAYAIMIKLLLPARTYQIRMLDSGEGDTYRYNENGIWEKNTSIHRPTSNSVPIEQGVFRRYKRRDGSYGAVFYFNTNKTADVDSIAKGYVMPWEKQDALQLLVKLRDWQEKYNSLKGSTAWSDIAELKPQKHIDDLKAMGTTFFLFRDPSSIKRPDLPITDNRVRNLWLKLMDEMERRLTNSNERLSNGEPIKLVLTRDKRGQAATATFDLHSLRVSIITAMYEEGVPPEYLMKIVGHATVLMTLYYTKIHTETLSLRMDESLLHRQRNEQAEMAGFIKRASRQEIERAVAFHSTSALDAVDATTGTGFLVMDHGICPTGGRRCHEGLAVKDQEAAITRIQSILGGATNCTRCRFFITGPAFLFGMEAHLNDLSYRLKNASYVFEKAQDKFDTLSDAYAASVSGGEPFHRQRELEIAETSFEAAMTEVDNIALSLQSAYILIEQCIQITKQNDVSKLALVAAGGTNYIEAVLSETHEFEQLNHICINATFFDGLNINWKQPNLERARLFDRMLRNSGYEPFFSLLDDEDALRAANAMGQFLYARLDANSVHNLIDGETTMQIAGIDKTFISELKKIEPKYLTKKSIKLLEK